MSDWLIYALGSACFAALTAVLGKIGVGEINSNLATLIRSVVIVAMVACIVGFRGEWQAWDSMPPKAVAMLILSAVATGLSWLCYYRALQLGAASKVASVDKLSVVFVVVLSVLLLGEKLTWKLGLGCLLVASGGVVLAF